MENKYIDSNIPWIGKIPEDWKLLKFKELCSSKKEIVGNKVDSYDRLALTLNGVIKRSKTDSDGLQPEDFSGYQIINKGDFIFKMIDLQNLSTSRVGLSDYTGIVSPAYIRFEHKKQNARYIYYFLMYLYYSYVYNNLGGNGVRSALNASDMGNLFIPLPSEKVQEEIVKIIEQKITNIDSLIEENEKEINKLQEYKKSLIYETVTKGIRKTKYKNSGISYLGEIPESWKVIKHKAILSKNKTICEKYNGESVLSLSMDGVVVRDLENPSGKMPTTFDGYQYVNKNNLLLCLFDIDITPRCVGIINDNGVTSPAYSQYILKSGNCLKYYYYLLLAIDNNKSFVHLSKNLRSSLSEDNFGIIDTIQPSFDEQNEIADYLDKKINNIDTLIKNRNSKIDKLIEYRTSMLYEYLTGKTY